MACLGSLGITVPMSQRKHQMSQAPPPNLQTERAGRGQQPGKYTGVQTLLEPVSFRHFALVWLAAPATLPQLRAGKIPATLWQEAFGSRLEVCGLWSVVCGLAPSTHPRRQQAVKRWPAVQAIPLRKALKETIGTEWELQGPERASKNFMFLRLERLLCCSLLLCQEDMSSDPSDVSSKESDTPF